MTLSEIIAKLSAGGLAPYRSWVAKDYTKDELIADLTTAQREAIWLIAATDSVPPTEVEVTVDNPSSGHHRTTATFKRSGANHGEPKTITGEGTTSPEATRDTFRKFLDDPRNAEYFSAPRKP